MWLSRAIRPVAWLLLCSFVCETIAVSRTMAEDELRVENVIARNEGSYISISYDLLSRDETPCHVSIRLLRRSSPTFIYVPSVGLSGAIGDAVLPGKNLSVEWAFAREFTTGLSGNDYFFEILAEPVAKSGSSFWWIAGGTALAGGVLILLLWKKPPPPPPDETPPDTFPLEPGRPS